MSPEREAQLHEREQGLHRVAVVAMRAAVKRRSEAAPAYDPDKDVEQQALAARGAEVRAALRAGPVALSSFPPRLRALADAMEALGADMDYFGGFGAIGVHGRELIGRAAMARGWADGIDADRGAPAC